MTADSSNVNVHLHNVALFDAIQIVYLHIYLLIPSRVITKSDTQRTCSSLTLTTATGPSSTEHKDDNHHRNCSLHDKHMYWPLSSLCFKKNKHIETYEIGTY